MREDDDYVGGVIGAAVCERTPAPDGLNKTPVCPSGMKKTTVRNPRVGVSSPTCTAFGARSAGTSIWRASRRLGRSSSGLRKAVTATELPTSTRAATAPIHTAALRVTRTGRGEGYKGIHLLASHGAGSDRSGASRWAATSRPAPPAPVVIHTNLAVMGSIGANAPMNGNGMVSCATTR